MTSTSPSKPPSAFKPVVLTDEAGVAFLRRHPATRGVVTTPLQGGAMTAALQFRDDADMPAQDDWVMPNADVPAAQRPDLRFENAGPPPPLGFWMTHPDVLAWTTSLLDDESAAWWVEVWLKDVVRAS